MRCAIWYQIQNQKNAININGGVLLLVQQSSMDVFHVFLNWSTKSCKASHMLFKTSYGKCTNQYLQTELFKVLNYLVGSTWQKLKWKYN